MSGRLVVTRVPLQTVFEEYDGMRARGSDQALHLGATRAQIFGELRVIRHANEILDVTKADSARQVVEDLAAHVDVELRVTAGVFEVIGRGVFAFDGQSVAHAEVLDALPSVRWANFQP